MEPKEIVDARRTQFDADQTWELLKTADAVTVAKGKKVRRFSPTKDDRDEILQAALGPSGNLRAPTYRAGKQFVIGFNADLYEDWLA